MNTRLFIFALFNILLLVGALIVGAYTYLGARRYFLPNVIYIAPKLNESHLFWDMSHMNTLEREFPDYVFSHESRSSAVLATSIADSVITTIIYCDSSYFNIHFFEFLSGAIWLDDTPSMVINERLAARLFGSVDIIGMIVDINDLPYVVTGVVRQNLDMPYTAWMPRRDNSLPITAIYVSANHYNLVNVGIHSHQMLTSIGRSSQFYAVIDINRFVETFSIRNRLLIYILWLYILFVLIITISGRLQSPTIGKSMVLRFKYLVVPVTIAGISIYFLYIGLNEILYWLPNLAIADVSLFRSISNIGALPPDGYLAFGLRRLSELNRLGNIAWLLGIIALVNLFFCRSQD